MSSIAKKHAQVQNQLADSRLLGKQSCLDCYDNSRHVHSPVKKTPGLLLLHDFTITGSLSNLSEVLHDCAIIGFLYKLSQALTMLA